MTRDELLTTLLNCASYDEEAGHYEADQVLVAFIDDAEITAAYANLTKWYA